MLLEYKNKNWLGIQIARFHKNYKVHPETGCWEWEKSLYRGGYGKFKMFNSAIISAHRASWFIKHKSLPDNLCVLHKCDNRKCVNPDHLFLGTYSDNSEDRSRKNRFCGENAGAAKLKRSEVIYILNSDFTMKNLAEKFGVCTSTINAIKSRENWKGITDEEIRNG